MTKPLIFNATMGALYIIVVIGGAIAEIAAVSVALFAVSGCLHFGMAALVVAINRHDGKRLTGLSPTRSPVWIVEPYADRGACWGCGLAPDGEPRSATGLRMCSWCRELYGVDRDNKRRDAGRGWPRAYAVASGRHSSR